MSPNRGDGKKTTFSLLPQAVWPAEATPPLRYSARYRSHGDGRWGTAGPMGDSRPLREQCCPRGGSDPLSARPVAPSVSTQPPSQGASLSADKWLFYRK